MANSEGSVQNGGAQDGALRHAGVDSAAENSSRIDSGVRSDVPATSWWVQSNHAADSASNGPRTKGGGGPDGSSERPRVGTRAGAASVTSQQLSASLARLETKSVEVNLSLDSISQWISRMEPRLESRAEEVEEQGVEERNGVETAGAVSEGAATVKGEEREAAHETAPVATGPVTERRRKAQGVPVERRRTAHVAAVTAGERRTWTLADVLPAARRRWIPIAAVAFVAVLLAVLLVPGSPPRQAAVSTADAGPVIAGAATSGQAKGSADVPWTESGDLERRGAPPGSALASSAVGGTSKNLPGSVQTPTQTGAGSRVGGAPVAEGLIARTGIAADTGATAGEASGAMPAGSAEPTAAAPVNSAVGGTTAGVPVYRRVNVSSGVMAGNLIFSPKPAYPKGIVGLFHPQGEVVMQAIISRRGRVQNLRVISGHFMLRGAAKNAVRTWRYRPYVINGTPVEVATIVSVEFHR